MCKDMAWGQKMLGYKVSWGTIVCGECKNQTSMQQDCETQASYLHLALSKAHQSLVKDDLCSCSAKVGYTIPGHACRQLFIFHVAHGQAFVSSWSARERSVSAGIHQF